MFKSFQEEIIKALPKVHGKMGLKGYFGATDCEILMMCIFYEPFEDHAYNSTSHITADEGSGTGTL